MSNETLEVRQETSETPANYMQMRPYIFGLLVFLVANMIFITR
jgi:hypothetical protein